MDASIGKIVAALVVLGAFYIYKKVTRVPKIPKLVEDKWWGPGDVQKEDDAVRPFKINIPDEEIKDLQDRLKNTLPFQPPLEGVNQHYGMNTKLLETVLDYWKNKYNWQQRQKFLNKFPQFTTSIQGLNIHFIHAKPNNVPQEVEVLPLMLLHGWPGSVREFYEMIPHLITPQKGSNFVFEVIVPSLPGFGFSDGAVRTGMGPIQISQIFNKLMIRLKFNRYYVHGGDFGSEVAKGVAVFYPENVIAIHRNWCMVNTLFSPKMWLASLCPSMFFTEKEVKKNYPLGAKLKTLVLESGYFHIQATKPDTIGVALRESPIGLAAYILEKFTSATNAAWKDLPDGGLTRKFTMDQLLDNVMIYWVSRSMTTAIRIYAAAFLKENRDLGVDYLPVRIPSGCNRFENEGAYPPETILRKYNTNLIHLTDFDDGGHFAAFEVPEVLAKDVYEFVQKVRNLPKEAKEL